MTTSTEPREDPPDKQVIVLEIDVAVIAKALVDYSDSVGGIPLRTRGPE